MRVYLDISEYWPKDETGQPRSVNSIYEEIRGTPNEVGRNTLTLARNGQLEKGNFANQVKLSRLVSAWSKQSIGVDDLLKIEEER